MNVVETAYAKINLGLKILDRRPDGYHSLLSVFQTVDLADRLELSLDGAPGLSGSHAGIPGGKENLVLKAETLIRRHAPVPEVRFSLEKNIPIGAGLGGGSSDAAASLRGLRSMHHLPWSDEALRGYAAEIGSDVPFFISGGTSVVSGMGELMQAVRWPFSFTYVLVYPGFPVSTRWAYGQLSEIGGNVSRYREMTEKLIFGGLEKEEFLASLENDFEAPVFRFYPVLGDIKRGLMEHGAGAAVMSGSGSTMIGVFSDPETARSYAETVDRGTNWVFLARPASGNSVSDHLKK